MLTLNAGASDFTFVAYREGERVSDPCVLPAHPDDLERSLSNLFVGLERIRSQAKGRVRAISLAFPGPADYAAGVIYNRGAFPAYSEGVPLGKILEDRFGVPVIISNDGDLFALGEARRGRLPEINRRLAESGSGRRFNHLIALTVGAGLGGGVVIDGALLRGDNGLASEVWLLGHDDRSALNAEAGVSARAITIDYAVKSGSSFQLTPRDVASIALGDAPGDSAAARRAFARFGRSLGGVVADLVSVIDGVVVLGGELTEAHQLFLPALLMTVGGRFSNRPDTPRRLVQCMYNLESAAEADVFFAADPTEASGVKRPRQARSAIAISRLDLTESISRGAYEAALHTLSGGATADRR